MAQQMQQQMQQGAAQGATGQDAQFGIGGFMGITPVPSPAASPAPALADAGPPTGTSPVAKRPLQRREVAMDSDAGPSRTMSTEDLTQGFYNLMRERERDMKWVQNIAVAVHDNAGLLNACLLYTSDAADE